jgi:hypothetical protein
MRRREFLKAGASTLLLGPFVLGSTGTGSASDPYSRAFFAERIGDWFEVDGTRSFELLAVEDGPVVGPFDQFSLAFRCDARDALPDGIHGLRAANGEPFALFLQRRPDDASGARYVANFSVSRPSGTASCA